MMQPVKTTKRTFSGRKKIYKKTKPVPTLVRSPKTYSFKQSFVETIELNTSAVPTGWTVNGNALVQQMVFNLQDISNYGRFTGMFAQYRLKSARSEFFFSATSSDVSDPNTAQSGNRQIIVYTMPNRVGSVETLTEDAFLQTQAHKKDLALTGMGKPVVCYTKLAQLSSMFASGINTDYAKVEPRFISTQESNTPHYGLDIRIERVDGKEFSNGSATYPYVKIIHTVYFETRQVN